MRLLGYTRVSTLDQHPVARHDPLLAAGCDELQRTTANANANGRLPR